MKLAYFFLLLIGITAAWGDFLRPEASSRGETSYGLSTLFLFAFILCSMFSGAFLKGLRKAAFHISAYGIFLFIAISNSIHVPEEGILQVCAYFVAYFALFIGVAGGGFSEKQMLIFLISFTLSLTLSSIVSILDYSHIIDVPRFNEKVNQIEIADIDFKHDSLCGPFYSRTILGVLLSLALPMSLAIGFQAKTGRARIVFFLSFACLALTSLLSGSRGLLLALPIVLVYVLFSTSQKVVQATLMGTFIFGAASIIAAILYPHVVDLLSVQIQRLTVHEVTSSEADLVRYHTLAITLDELVEHPFGMGFTQVVIPSIGPINPHSNVVTYLRGAGFLGFFCVVFFFWPVASGLLKRQGTGVDRVLGAALLSFGVYGLTHTTIGTQIFWICLGMFFSRIGSKYVIAPMECAAPDVNAIAGNAESKCN